MSQTSSGWLERRLHPQGRFGLRLTLFALATVLVAVPFFFLLVQVTNKGPVTRIDTMVSAEFHEEVIESPILEPTFEVISFIASPPAFYIASFVAAIFFWRRRSRRVAAYLVLTNLLGGAINTTVKVLVDRPRPQLDEPIGHAFGYSFPSGHTVGATVGFGSLLLAFMPFIPRRLRPVAIAGYFGAVALVAASRLGLVVHYFSDVLAGFILGLAWLSLATAAFSIWRSELGRSKVEVQEGLAPEA